MKLHAIKHDYRAGLWCGIAALATVSGRPTSECREAILAARSKRDGHYSASIRVTGIHNWELRNAALLLGINTRGIAAFNGPMKQRPTLGQYLRSRDAEARANVLIICVTGHYVTVKGRSFVDNHTKEVTPIKEAPFMRKRVETVWQCVPCVQFSDWKPPVKPPRKPSGRAAVLALAAAHGITVDDSDYRSFGHIWVYSERHEAAGDDPHEGAHIVDDWTQALQWVKDYIDVDNA